jgi:RNA polymerase sigma-70 factor (ECF subfamily)
MSPSMTSAPGPDAQCEHLYRQHRQRVFRLCMLLLADRDEAEEVAQEVFVKLFEWVRRESRSMAWGPWLTRVALNACRARRRSSWWRWWHGLTEQIEDDHFPGSSRTPEALTLDREQYRHFWRVFQLLPLRQKEVFVLRHGEGWSTAEVADALGIAEGSVKRHLFRAVRHLRRALGGHR